MLRHRADLRTLAYLLAMPVVLVLLWRGGFHPGLYLVCLTLAVAASVIAHNHNHLGIWRSRRLNALTDFWITLFYGFPTFGWIPTHNANHHKLNNREGDYTKTWRFSEENNLWTLLSYPSVSSRYQLPEIWIFLKEAWARDRGRALHYVAQAGVLLAFVAGALLLDWQKALLYVVIPQQLSMFSVLIFNYVQHVHCDEESEWDHSRNIVGPGLNFLLFNNGFHTVHHMKPGLHWSETPAAHAQIAARIRPELNPRSFWGYIFRSYVLGAFSPRHRTRSLRLERLARESSQAA